MVKKTFTVTGKAHNKSLSLIFSPMKSPSSRLQVNSTEVEMYIKRPSEAGHGDTWSPSTRKSKAKGQEFKVNPAVL